MAVKSPDGSDVEIGTAHNEEDKCRSPDGFDVQVGTDHNEEDKCS